MNTNTSLQVYSRYPYFVVSSVAASPLRDRLVFFIFKILRQCQKKVSITSKVRFEIFKRDSFTCQYCGKSTPSVTLEIDHIKPVCEGGDNSDENLITACFDCNRGKAGNSLTQIIPSLEEKTKLILEKEEQYKAFLKVQNSIEKRMKKDIAHINSIYTGYFPDYELKEQFLQSSVRKFISMLGVHEVEISMHSAINKIGKWDSCIKYFCGICWNKIKN